MSISISLSISISCLRYQGLYFVPRFPSTNRQEIIWYLLHAWYCARYILRHNGDCYIKPIIKQITVCAISKIASYKTKFIIFPHG